MKRLRNGSWALHSLLLLAASASGQEAGEPPTTSPAGFASPREAFEAAASAEQKGDWGAEFDVYLPEDRNLVLARAMSLCDISASTGRERSDELYELLKKSGAKLDSRGITAFDDAELAEEAFASVKDARALWVSLRIWFERHESSHEPSRFLGRLGEISDYDGTASGVVSLVRGGQTVLWFQKVGRSWFVSPGAVREQLNRDLCRDAIQEIAKRVRRFREEQDRWPRTLSELAVRPDDLKAWPEGGYLPSIPRDPWGGEFALVVPGRDETEFEVIAYGKDRKPGGEGTGLDAAGTCEKPAPEKK